MPFIPIRIVLQTLLTTSLSCLILQICPKPLGFSLADWMYSRKSTTSFIDGLDMVSQERHLRASLAICTTALIGYWACNFVSKMLRIFLLSDKWGLIEPSFVAHLVDDSPELLNLLALRPIQHQNYTHPFL